MSDLTDADLLVYIDHAASPEVVAQVEQSPALMERVRELRSLETTLRARLFRVECPDPHLLGEYWLDALSANQASQIRQHIEHCTYCAEELRNLQNFMAPGVVDRIRKIVANLLSGGTSYCLQPAAGVRGDEPEPRIYTAGTLQVILEIHPEKERPERRSLIGLVTGPLESGMVAQLLAAELLPGSVPVGEMGEFTFHDLPPGEYMLRLLTMEEEIQIPPFMIE